MEQIAQVERPGVLTRLFFKIGERMFGQVPTPERLMARRHSLLRKPRTLRRATRQRTQSAPSGHPRV